MAAAAARRYAANVDHNQPEIVAALRKAGATVEHLHAVGAGCPDLCVGYNGETYLMEIKNPDANGKLNKIQEAWHDSWVGHACVVHSVEEALAELKIGDY